MTKKVSQWMGAATPAQSFHYSNADMLSLGETCSTTERRADEATRDAADWLKCEYMLDKVGESFEGIITSATSFGLFVELDDIYVEGLVHVTSLKNDYYHFDPAKHCLQGEHSRQSYRLGDKVRVQVVRVNLDDRKIDFELTDEGEVLARPPRKKRSRRGGKAGKGEGTAVKKKATKKGAAARKKVAKKKAAAPAKKKGGQEQTAEAEAAPKPKAKRKRRRSRRKKTTKPAGDKS
jgi:ribonuclease R